MLSNARYPPTEKRLDEYGRIWPPHSARIHRNTSDTIIYIRNMPNASETILGRVGGFIQNRRHFVLLFIIENNIDNIIEIYYNNIVDNIFDNGGGCYEGIERR